MYKKVVDPYIVRDFKTHGQATFDYIMSRVSRSPNNLLEVTSPVTPTNQFESDFIETTTPTINFPGTTENSHTQEMAQTPEIVRIPEISEAPQIIQKTEIGEIPEIVQVPVSAQTPVFIEMQDISHKDEIVQPEDVEQKQGIIQNQEITPKEKTVEEQVFLQNQETQSPVSSSTPTTTEAIDNEITTYLTTPEAPLPQTTETASTTTEAIPISSTPIQIPQVVDVKGDTGGKFSLSNPDYLWSDEKLEAELNRGKNVKRQIGDNLFQPGSPEQTLEQLSDVLERMAQILEVARKVDVYFSNRLQTVFQQLSTIYSYGNEKKDAITTTT